MATASYELELQPPSRLNTKPIWNSLMILGAIFLGNQVIAGGAVLRIVSALAVLVAFIVPALEHPKSAMYMLFSWLPFLGIIRRVLVPATGYTSLDPLLLISSAVVIIILLTLLFTGKAEMGGSPLSFMVFLFLMIGLLQVFNPAQGGIFVGLTGVMFVLVPVMCFFIGRSVADPETLAKLQRYMIFVGVIAGAYGLFQVYIGFPGFEQAYLAKAGFGGLYVGSAIRPFSTFTNPLEYSLYLSFCVMTTLSYLIYKRNMSKFLLLGALGFMVYAGYMIGSRGFIYSTVVGAIILLGSRARNMIVAFFMIAAIFGGVFLVTSSQTGSDGIVDENATAAQTLQERQNAALLDPTDPTKSTLGVHYKGVKEGLVYAFTEEPFGLGTGSTGRGSTKFGDGRSSSTELDISDAAISFGIVGGLLYMGIIVLAGWQLFRMRTLFSGPMWPAVMGMAVVSFGQWLNGGNYAVAPLIWFMLGASDMAFLRAKREKLAEQQALVV